jgi:hypothetical protein
MEPGLGESMQHIRFVRSFWGVIISSSRRHPVWSEGGSISVLGRSGMRRMFYSFILFYFILFIHILLID